MIFGEKEPATLYSLEVLRKAKQQSTAQKYLTTEKRTKCPVKNVEILKYTSPYSVAIHNIGLDNFLHYWLPEQLLLCNQYITSTEDAITAFDATGSLVHKIRRPYLLIYFYIMKSLL